jgi:hypothetical protein
LNRAQDSPELVLGFGRFAHELVQGFAAEKLGRQHVGIGANNGLRPSGVQAEMPVNI